MARQQSDNFAEDLVAVLFSPPALVAMLVLMATAAGQALLVTARISELASSVGMAMIGLIMTVLSVLQGIIALAVQYVLSRMLGSADGTAGKPDFGAWIGFAILYFFTVWAANMMVTFFVGIVTGSSFWLIPLASGLVGLVVRVALFPLLVRLVSLAHDRNGPKFGAVWGFLTGTHPGIYGGYAGFCLLVALLPLLGMFARLDGGTGAMGTGFFLVLALATGFSQILLFAYAIATYRSVAGDIGANGAFS